MLSAIAVDKPPAHLRHLEAGSRDSHGYSSTPAALRKLVVLQSSLGIKLAFSRIAFSEAKIGHVIFQASRVGSVLQ